MKKPIGRNQKTETLRQSAEHVLASNPDAHTDMLPFSEKRLLHELQVHQIELEMQNEALQEAVTLADKARIAAEMAQAHYTELFDFAPIAYFSLGKDGVIQTSNLRGAKLLNIQRSKISGQKFSHCVAVEHQSSFNRFLEEVFASNVTLRLEISLRLGETPCWMAIEALADHSRLACLAAVSDISHQKQAEHASNLLKTLIDISFDGFLTLDFQGNLIQVNAAYAKISGYTQDELTNMNIHQLKPIEDSAQIKVQMVRIIDQGFHLFETRHRHKNGHIIELEISAAFLADYPKIFLFCRDITSRKKAEARLNSIFNAALEGIISFGMSRIIVSVNAAIERIFGYKPEELIGCHITRIIPLLPKCPNDGCLPQEHMPAAQVTETEGIRKDGSVVPLDITQSGYNLDGECHFTTIVRDISLRKQREQADREHLNELAHVTRLALMSEFASGIAHEVNQPLTAITNYTHASMHLIKSANADPAELLDILSNTQQQALRAGQIIRRMREFISNQPRQYSNVQMNALIHNAINLCVTEIRQNRIQLKLELEDHTPPVCADYIQIEQVLLNLIRNSIDSLKSLPENQQRQISFRTQLTADNDILVSVEDNGPGIAEDRKAKIFMPFTTTKAEGMGMGLSICRSLIEVHGGVLSFKSLPGKGCCFYFTLPLGTESNGS